MAGIMENGPPQKEGPHERDQSEEDAQEEVPSINEGVLQTNVDDMQIFGKNPTHAGKDMMSEEAASRF